MHWSLGRQTRPSAQSCLPNLGLLLGERVVKDLCSDVFLSGCHEISTRGHCYPSVMGVLCVSRQHYGPG
jgi:hypothetical protein